MVVYVTSCERKILAQRLRISLKQHKMFSTYLKYESEY